MSGSETPLRNVVFLARHAQFNRSSIFSDFKSDLSKVLKSLVSLPQVKGNDSSH